MAAISGKSGTISIGSGICVKEWSVDITTDRLDSTTTCSNGKREYIAGLRTATGSVTAYEFVPKSGATAVSFANGSVTVSGTALINESISSPVDGIVEFTYDLQFTGPVTVS